MTSSTVLPNSGAAMSELRARQDSVDLLIGPQAQTHVQQAFSVHLDATDCTSYPKTLNQKI